MGRGVNVLHLASSPPSLLTSQRPPGRCNDLIRCFFFSIPYVYAAVSNNYVDNTRRSVVREDARRCVSPRNTSRT